MWTISRQIQWPSGERVVEISRGGPDYTNPDALTAQYEGEFETLRDPREAADTALRIARAWARAQRETVGIGCGSTMGWTLPFDPIVMVDPRGHVQGLRDLHNWAEGAWERAPKCDECSDALPDDARRIFLLDLADDERYCSDSCADTAYCRIARESREVAV